MSTKKTAIRGQAAASREVYWENPRPRASAPQPQGNQPAQVCVPMDRSPAKD